MALFSLSLWEASRQMILKGEGERSRGGRCFLLPQLCWYSKFRFYLFCSWFLDRPTYLMSCELPSPVFPIFMYQGSRRGLSLLFTSILQGIIYPLSSNLLPFQMSYQNRVIDPLLLLEPSMRLLSSWIKGLALALASTLLTTCLLSVILIEVREEFSTLFGERETCVILQQAKVLMTWKVVMTCWCSMRFLSRLMGLSILLAARTQGRALRLRKAHILFSMSLVSSFLKRVWRCSSEKMRRSYLPRVAVEEEEGEEESGKRKNCLRSWKQQLLRLASTPCSRLPKSSDPLCCDDDDCLLIVVFYY